MTYLFDLIRWKNLVMIALVQYLVKYGLLEPFINSHGVTTTLSGFGFAILVLSTLCIAAAGNIINDIYDVEADKINKPNKVYVGTRISEKNALNLFITLNVIGVCLGLYISNVVGKSQFFVLFVIISALLYVYASFLKQITLIGNIVISVLVAMSLIIVGIFDLIPVLNTENSEIQFTFLKIIRDYAIFAFIINLLREIIKDIEDIDGDYKTGLKTLPIVIGRDRATKLAFILSLTPIVATIYYVTAYLFKQLLAVGYFLALVIAPLLYITLKLYTAEHKKQYSHLSMVLKLVMLTGMFSMMLYKYILI